MFDVKYDRDGNVISSAPEQPVEKNEPQEKPEETQEDSQQETQDKQEATQDQENDTQVAVAHKKELSNQEENWRRLREKQQLIERERDEARQRLKDLEEKYKQQPQEPVQKAGQQELMARKQSLMDQINDDDFIEGKTLKKLYKELEDTKSQLQQYHQATSEMAITNRLHAQYPDFDRVVNEQNIKLLRDMYPEIASTVENSTSDLYNKALSAYTMIKRFGLYEDADYAKDRERAQKNAQKPRPLASVSPQQGDTPLSHANQFADGLTDELKKKLRRELYESRKNN